MDYWLCVVCYSPLSEQDRKTYCVRCKTCRELMQASAKQEKQQKKAQQEALWESKLRKCYECEYSTNCGGVLYCPAADGTCLKDESALTAAYMQPTVDAEPVRHGRWEEPYAGDIWDSYRCTCCGEIYDRTYNYCPYCGREDGW